MLNTFLKNRYFCSHSFVNYFFKVIMGFIFYCSSTVYYKTTLLKIYISSFCNKPKLLFLFDVNNYNCNGMFLLMFRETHLLFAYKESNTKSLTDIR